MNEGVLEETNEEMSELISNENNDGENLLLILISLTTSSMLTKMNLTSLQTISLNLKSI